MKTYAVIASYSSDLRRPDYASGYMVWDLRENQWLTMDGDDDTTTTATATTQNEQEAWAALELAKEDMGALFNPRLMVMDDEDGEAFLTGEFKNDTIGILRIVTVSIN